MNGMAKRHGGPRRAAARPARKAKRAAGRCPACGTPARHEFRPFCSRRCQDADLGRWLRGAYRIPTEQGPGGGGGAPDEKT